MKPGPVSLFLATLATAACGVGSPVQEPEMTTQSQARQAADTFVAAQQSNPRYTLEFETVQPHKDGFRIRYTKVFAEPTKESPPYRLVLVDAQGDAAWALP